MPKDNDEDVSILKEDNPQIYAHLNSILVHMIDKPEAGIFKSKEDFNQNKEKISEYIKYAENWQIISVTCSYTAMACDILPIVAMIVFLLKYHKTMQVMLAAFLQTNTKNSGIQSVQADQIGRTYPPLFTINLLKEEEILDDLTLICIEALQNQWYFRGFFLLCNHLHLEPRVMHCQLPATLDFSLYPLLVPIINRGYLFGLSTSPMTLFC